MTVQEMINHLEKFPKEMPLVIRKSYEDGAFADYIPHKPCEFHPGGQVCLSAFEQVETQKELNKELKAWLG